MARPLSLCVFCGSSQGNDPKHRLQAARLGRLIAKRGIRLVYGGAKVGLMGVLADAALEAGGQVTGVVPRHLTRAEVAHEALSEMIVVESMHERKRKMFELASAFAALPGGLGTLDETNEIITWKLLGLHDKPILLVDQDGYWGPLTDLIDHAVASGFAEPSVKDLFTLVADSDGVIAALESASAPEITPFA